MIKAIIFDLNGVFIQGPYLSERYNEKYGVEKDDFFRVMDNILQIVRLPDAGDTYSHFKPSLKKWDIKMSRADFYDFWFKSEKMVPSMVRMVKELKKDNFQIYILSNNFKERTKHYLKVYPKFKNLFDKMYFSWQTGYRKDNIKAYRNVLKDNNLKANECVFFDDKDKMVEMAESAGIHSYKFRDARGVKRVINKLSK